MKAKSRLGHDHASVCPPIHFPTLNLSTIPLRRISDLSPSLTLRITYRSVNQT